MVIMRKEIYSFTLDPEIAEKLEQLSIKENRTKSQLVNNILKEYLDSI